MQQNPIGRCDLADGILQLDPGRSWLAGEREAGLQLARCPVRIEHQDAEDANNNQVDSDHPE